jgi:hypothetical protein
VIEAVELRPATACDAGRLERLAQLDSSDVPLGRLLVAEAGGRLLAAYAMESGEAIADPFSRTAHLVEALRAQADDRTRGGREWTQQCSPQPAT